MNFYFFTVSDNTVQVQLRMYYVFFCMYLNYCTMQVAYGENFSSCKVLLKFTGKLSQLCHLHNCLITSYLYSYPVHEIHQEVFTVVLHSTITTKVFQCKQFALKGIVLAIFVLLLMQNQCTPLHIAAKAGHNFTVESLIKSGADVNAVDEVSIFVHRLTVTKLCCFALGYLGAVDIITFSCTKWPQFNS